MGQTRAKHYDGRVVDQHVPPRVSGPFRILGLLVLVLGIAAMHTGLLSIHPGANHVVREHTNAMAETLGDHQESAMVVTNDDHAIGHRAMHACVFTLSVMALVIGLVLLYRSGVGFDEVHLPKSRHWRIHRERPPPWTAPSLAELSILRI
ncbi:DUF6153 family protein [Nocardia asiatica]